MKSISKSLLLFITVISFSLSCNRNAEVVRQLHYADLLDPENSTFFNYPNEFSSYLLNGVLKNKLQAYYIDYDSSGQIVTLDQETFINNIVEPYEYYEDEPEFEQEPIQENPKNYLSYITLLSFDNLVSEGREFSQYINFYHPADVTPEGLNIYIGSVKYESALEYLNELTPSLVWHNYKIADWGWLNGQVFISDISTSSRLAADLIVLSDSSTLSSRILDSLTINQIQKMASENPLFLNSKISSPGKNRIDVIYRDDSITTRIAAFTFKDLELISEKKRRNDSVTIVPVQTALVENKLKTGRIKRISRNGSFDKPLKGDDELSKRKPTRTNLKKSLFPDSQKFYFRTVERLIGEDYKELDALPELLYAGVRNGSITVYQKDSLSKRMLPGEFFDNMILDVDDNVIAEAKSLRIYTIVTETVFKQNGNIEKVTPIGIGLFLPGKDVPEGFNRQIGYFKIQEIVEYQSGNEIKAIDFQSMKGYPLSSWNITLFSE